MFSRRATKKARKRHGFAYYVVGLFTLAIEFMLGVNAAFLVDQSVVIVAANMLAGTILSPLAPFIALLASVAVGMCFVLGGLWTFSGFVDSLEDAKAYCDEYGTSRWPVVMVWLLFIGIILLDFTTLGFRAAYFAARGETSLLAFFVILILLPPVLGPLLHVLEHTPRDRRLAKVRQYVEALETDDLEVAVKEMNPALRTRLLNDDPTAITDYYAQAQQEQEMIESAERQKLQERKQKRIAARRPLVPASLDQQAKQRSQNL
jgi:hypothetical protein